MKRVVKRSLFTSVLPLFELTVKIQACLEVVEVTSASELLLSNSQL